MRAPWAPLNMGAFLIILGVFLLAGFTSIIPLAAAFPLVFTVFGAWLAFLAVVLPPSGNPYGAPRSMVLGWGGLLAGIGILWYVGFNATALLPAAFAVLIIIVGIAAVSYSFLRAQNKGNGPVS